MIPSPKAFRGPLKTSLAALLMLGTAGSALAQAPIQVESIDARTPEAYRPVPIRANAFEITPYVETEVELVDNIFAVEADGVNDTVLSLIAGVGVGDRRQDRQIALRASVGHESYLDNTFEDRFRFNGTANARFGLGTLTQTFIGGSVRHNGLQTSGLTASSGIGRPIDLTNTRLNAGLRREFGDITARFEGRYLGNRYGGNFFVSGEPFDAGIRDLDVYQGRARLGYRVSPRDRVYVAAVYSDRRTKDLRDREDLLPGLRDNRSSEDIALRVGYTREISEILSLDANIGYLDRSFADPARDNQGSLSFDARVAWQPTQLTDIDLRAARLVDANNDPLSTGLLRTEVAGSIQHELLRNVIIAGDARYSWLDLGGDDDLMLDDGKELIVGSSVRYLFSRHWSARLRAEYLDRNGFFDGSQTRVSVGLRYNF